MKKRAKAARKPDPLKLYKEAVAQQAATAEILKVIAESPSETQPVFDAIARSARRQFGALYAVVTRLVGDELHHAANSGTSAAGTESLRKLFPAKVTGQGALGKAVLSGKPTWIADVETDSAYSEAFRDGARERGYRSLLCVPMLRDGVAIGAIAVTRSDPGLFTDHQISLLGTFADQAVIAIENVRLFNETREALERQKASGDILRVIAGSPTDVQPVLDAMAESAARLCGANDVIIRRVDGGMLRIAAHFGSVPITIEMHPMTRATVGGRAALERRTIHVEDIVSAASRAEFPEAPALQRDVGYHTMLAVPLVRNDVAVGIILLRRLEVRLFSDQQVALLESFADQAVIAIENTRLFNETKEALERQTATAEILQVIGSSPTDTQPVFDAIVNSGVRLFPGAMITVARPDGGTVRAAAIAHEDTAMVAGWRERFTTPLSRDRLHAAAILDAKLIDFPDAEAEKDGPLGPGVRNFLLSGNRAVTIMPMLRGEGAIGAISVTRAVPGPLSDKQIAILRTFADQAVIAIENVRLFNETKEALERQTASGEVLSVIAGTPADAQPVFNAIAQSALRLFGVSHVGITVLEGDSIRSIATAGSADPRGEFVFPLNRDSTAGRSMLDRTIINIGDTEAPESPSFARDSGRLVGFRAIAAAPMLREGAAIGSVHMMRKNPGPFSDAQMDLLKTFANQAVIAIENARLFREIEEKSAQLEVANRHKSEFLANMSHELRTPLNAIIGFSEVLSEKMFGEVNEKQADYLKDIHESGRHLLSLINDILDLSKIEAGRMELELASFHLPSAISNAITLIRERAQRHGIQLGLEVDERLGEFQADERKLKQILLNLLSNAVKFTPDGGRVDVAAALNGKSVEIAIRDSGIGISPEDQAMLFEEFKQVGQDAGRKAEGTGLGLALTKRFVELHGGEIRVQSEPGKGSTFTVLLPLR